MRFLLEIFQLYNYITENNDKLKDSPALGKKLKQANLKY